MSEDRLATVLQSVGEYLETDVDLRARTPHHEPRRWTPTVLAVAAALVGATLVVLLIAPVRDAVAGWLGLGSTRIVVDPELAASEEAQHPVAAGLATIGPAAARERLGGRDLPDLTGTALGAPTRLAEMPEGGVLVIWRDGSTLWIHHSTIDVGVVVKKLVSSEASVIALEGLGDAALIISGDHVLSTPHRTVAAGSVVLWTTDGFEFRLESDRAVDEIVDLAREVASSE